MRKGSSLGWDSGYAPGSICGQIFHTWQHISESYTGINDWAKFLLIDEVAFINPFFASFSFKALCHKIGRALWKIGPTDFVKMFLKIFFFFFFFVK